MNEFMIKRPFEVNFTIYETEFSWENNKTN